MYMVLKAQGAHSYSGNFDFPSPDYFVMGPGVTAQAHDPGVANYGGDAGVVKLEWVSTHSSQPEADAEARRLNGQ